MIFKERRQPKDRFQRILEEVKSRLTLVNLTESEINGVFELFKLSVDLTESFEHVIEEEDLIKEFRYLLIGVYSYGGVKELGKKLSQFGEYDHIFKSFFTAFSNFLDPQRRKYFKQNSSGAKGWYGAHLEDVLSRTLRYSENEYSNS